MDAAEFRKRGREMVDFIADYMEDISNRRVLPEVKPGYLRELLPSTAPNKPENWSEIVEDIERAILPGITHWQHPQFHAYFPSGNAYESILGDMLSDAIGCLGFSWAASPACTELEIVVLDWIAKMIGLPPVFWHENGIGGGVLQGSASECVLVSVLAARHSALRDLKLNDPEAEDGILLTRLVAYRSKLAHSCVEKAGMIGLVNMRELDVDENFSMRGEALEAAIKEDRKNGLIPFYVCATLGTTAVCSFDNIDELGLICEKEGLWLHVDAAYAGSAFICPEFRHILKGIEHAASFNLNPNKWMLVNHDCSTMWVRDRKVLTRALTVDPLYLQHNNSDKAVDFRHWGIPLSRRFRALKLWFVIRSYGLEGLQNYVRSHCRLAKKFESLVKTDPKFEVKGNVTMGLVCFRLKGPNYHTQILLRSINMSGRLHMVPAILDDDYIIRFAVCHQHATEDDMSYAWEIISNAAKNVLECLSSSDSAEDKRQALEAIHKIESIDAGSDEDESNQPHSDFLFGSYNQETLKAALRGGEQEIDNSEKEEEVFPYDNNIPSIPSTVRAGSGKNPVSSPDAISKMRRRNRFLRMISETKCYPTKLVKSVSIDVPERRRLRSRGGGESDESELDACDLLTRYIGKPKSSQVNESGPLSPSGDMRKQLNNVLRRQLFSSNSCAMTEVDELIEAGLVNGENVSDKNIEGDDNKNEKNCNGKVNSTVCSCSCQIK